MRILMASILASLLPAFTQAQSVPGNRVQLTFQPTNTAGATISVSPQGGGRSLGTYSLVSNGRNQTEFRADLSSLNPTSSKLELLSGTNVVRTIPGPAVGECDYVDEVAYAGLLRPEDDWVWLAIGAVAYLITCADYTQGTTTTSTTINSDGTSSTTTSTTSGYWSWDCGLVGGIVVNVDGTDYSNITGLRITSTVSGSLPAVSSLNVLASGGARITSLR